jgi:GTPase involved in cell partitioning and DNA repair
VLTQDKLTQLEPALRILCLQWLLPCTLLANFSIMIKKEAQPAPSKAIELLQSYLKTQGDKLADKTGWILFVLLNKLDEVEEAKSNKRQKLAHTDGTDAASAAAVTTAPAVASSSSANAAASASSSHSDGTDFSVQKLCDLLHQERVHVPLKPNDPGQLIASTHGTVL